MAERKLEREHDEKWGVRKRKWERKEYIKNE
jgi:hypothetical protein